MTDIALVVSVEQRDKADLKPKHRKHDNICLTPECVQLSADILRSFGDSDPCDDFYDCTVSTSHPIAYSQMHVVDGKSEWKFPPIEVVMEQSTKRPRQTNVFYVTSLPDHTPHPLQVENYPM